jgi:endonuclease YncB( thermonuclease family)
MVRLIAVALSLFCVVANVGAEPIEPSEIKVSDGDTVRAHGERYRLVGFDTPETWSRRRAVPPHERALGKQARKRLKQLIAAGGVDLEEVPCACTKHTRLDDQGRCRTNGRLCAVLSVNGENVGRTLIAEGLAREFICSATECPKQLPW